MHKKICYLNCRNMHLTSGISRISKLFSIISIVTDSKTTRIKVEDINQINFLNKSYKVATL